MPFESRRFFENVVPDLKDNLESAKPPARAVEGLSSPEDAEPLVRHVFLHEGEDIRPRLHAELAKLPEGMSRARMVVGDRDEGTRHPHDYVVEKEGEAVMLYFVDPEHQMGKSKRHGKVKLPRPGDFRPKVGNLMSVRFASQGAAPEISILRFRTAGIEDQHVLKMSQQLEEARTLARTGELPAFLAGKENEVIFRLTVRGDALAVESRYATPEQLEQFLHGHADTNMLRGKLRAASHITVHFLRYMERGNFKADEPPAAAPELRRAA